MKQRRVLIKLGGSSLQDESVVNKLAELVRLQRASGAQVYVVHGGGPAINAELTKRGITWTFLDGQRITTPEMVDTIEMVLKGYVNGKIVRALNQADLPAFGVSGSENFLLKCEPSRPELQRVGRITEVNTKWLIDLTALASTPVPVVAPLGVSAAGEVYNINADWAAAKMAMALRVDELIYLTDQTGIWDADKNLISQIDSSGLQNLIDTEVVLGGMLAKTQTIISALAAGVKKIRILHAKDAVTGFQDASLGTHCLPATELEKEAAHA